MGRYQGSPSVMNLWIHDASKDTTVNRLKYRELLKASLYEIYSEQLDYAKDCIEAKLSGFGA